MSFQLADTALIYAGNQKLAEDVAEIIEWLTTQAHLPEITELQIILFLHACFYDKEATKRTVANYFTLRTNSHLFTGAKEELFRRVLSTLFIGLLPKRTPDGDAIFLMKFLDPRPEKYNFVEQVNVAVLVIVYYFHQFGPANGLIVINDAKDAALGHLLRINLSTMKQLLHFVQEAAPTRIKAIHIINVVPVAQRLFYLIKPFVKSELYNLIKFHLGSVESLYQHVPKECLPEEYGGELPPIEQLHEKNIQNLIKNLDFVEWHDSQRVDETKRVLKVKKGFFGSVQGFFRL